VSSEESYEHARSRFQEGFGFDPESWEALTRGFGATGAGGDGHEPRCVELCPICRTADVLRATGPPELRGQLADFQREALLTLRSLLDHYIERLDERPAEAGRVEHIPID
jgi:hypothetical protein